MSLVLFGGRNRRMKGSVSRCLTGNKERPAIANQVLAAMSAVFRWALEQEIIETNPARDIKRNPCKPAERYLSDDELKSAWVKFEDLGFHATIKLRLMLTTAQRPGEVCSMRWQDLDLQKRIWTLPGDPDGDWPGTKNGRTHEVPLSSQAIVLLEELDPQKEGNVFPSARIPITKSIWDGLDIPRFRPHDLRATAASGMDALGIHREHISRVLNHVEGGVTASYIRHDHMDQKRRALDAWGAYLEAIVKGLKPPSDVVDIRTARESA